MADEVFTDPDETRDEWVDVRMTGPEKEEWDVDVVVVGGQVEYVDLRVKPELLAEFVECLIDDVGTEQSRKVLANVADRTDTDLPGADE